MQFSPTNINHPFHSPLNVKTNRYAYTKNKIKKKLNKNINCMNSAKTDDFD